MILIPVRCPYCDCGQVVKHGKTENAKQRYLCQQPECLTQSFILDDDSQVIFLNQKRMIGMISMALNGSGIRATMRLLETNPATAIGTFRVSIIRLWSK